MVNGNSGGHWRQWLVLVALLLRPASAQNPDLFVDDPRESIDLKGCIQDLYNSDEDGSGAVEFSEYLGFINKYGIRLCWSQDAITLEQIGTFNKLACLCENFDPDPNSTCCLGSNAKLPTDTPVNPDVLSDRDLFFLSQVCILTDRTMTYGCGDDPVNPDDDQDDPADDDDDDEVDNDRGFKNLDLDEKDGRIWPTVMGIIGALLLLCVCLPCCLVAAKPDDDKKKKKKLAAAALAKKKDKAAAAAHSKTLSSRDVDLEVGEESAKDDPNARPVPVVPVPRRASSQRASASDPRASTKSTASKSLPKVNTASNTSKATAQSAKVAARSGPAPKSAAAAPAKEPTNGAVKAAVPLAVAGGAVAAAATRKREPDKSRESTTSTAMDSSPRASKTVPVAAAGAAAAKSKKRDQPDKTRASTSSTAKPSATAAKTPPPKKVTPKENKEKSPSFFGRLFAKSDKPKPASPSKAASTTPSKAQGTTPKSTPKAAPAVAVAGVGIAKQSAKKKDNDDDGIRVSAVQRPEANSPQAKSEDRSKVDDNSSSKVPPSQAADSKEEDVKAVGWWRSRSQPKNDVEEKKKQEITSPESKKDYSYDESLFDQYDAVAPPPVSPPAADDREKNESQAQIAARSLDKKAVEENQNDAQALRVAPIPDDTIGEEAAERLVTPRGEGDAFDWVMNSKLDRTAEDDDDHP